MADSEMVAQQNEKVTEESPRSLEFAKRGIRTGSDFASTMSALMSDLLQGSVSPEVANSVCNAGGKLLKVVEMKYKYGTKGARGERNEMELQLVSNE